MYNNLHLLYFRYISLYVLLTSFYLSLPLSLTHYNVEVYLYNYLRLSYNQNHPNYFVIKNQQHNL